MEEMYRGKDDTEKGSNQGRDMFIKKVLCCPWMDIIELQASVRILTTIFTGTYAGLCVSMDVCV